MGVARLGLSAAAVALLAGACGGTTSPGSSPTSPATATTSTPGTPSSLTTSPTPVTTATFGYGAVSVPDRTTPTRAGLLTDVAVSGTAGPDLVRLTFRSGPPGCRVRYTSPPIKADPSDQVVAVAGTAFLQIVCRPASGTDLTAATPVTTYTGPDRVTGATANVTEAVLTGDFEAVLTWTIGLQGRAPFAVDWTGPSSGKPATVDVYVMRAAG